MLFSVSSQSFVLPFFRKYGKYLTIVQLTAYSPDHLSKGRIFSGKSAKMTFEGYLYIIII